MNGFPTFPKGVSFAGYWDASVGYYPQSPDDNTFWIVIDSGAINGIDYPAGSCIKYIANTFSKAQGFLMDWRVISNKPPLAGEPTPWDNIPDKPVGANLENNIAIRDSSGDLEARRFISRAYSQSKIPDGSAMAFRVGAETDPYVRFAPKSAILDYLGKVNDSALVEGKTVDEIKSLARQGVALNSVKVNGQPLTQDVNLTAADVGLDNVPNFKAISSPRGTSTSLLATQRAAYEAAGAPLLEAERKRKITVSSREPTGSDGEDGEIWLVYQE